MNSSAAKRTNQEHDGDLVVFLIGMTINQWWRPDRWLPVFIAMPRMLAELSRDKQSGLLRYRIVVAGRGPMVIQYWSSSKALHEYASNPAAQHRPAWQTYNARARKNPRAVGIWHETYDVSHSRLTYVNVPRSPLAATSDA